MDFMGGNETSALLHCENRSAFLEETALD